MVDKRSLSIRCESLHYRLAGYIERGHFLDVSDQKAVAGDDGMIPGFAANRLEPRQLLVPFRCRSHEHHFAFLA